MIDDICILSHLQCLIFNVWWRCFNIDSCITFQQIAAMPKHNTTKCNCRKLATNFQQSANNKRSPRNYFGTFGNFRNAVNRNKPQTTKSGGGGVRVAWRIGINRLINPPTPRLGVSELMVHPVPPKSKQPYTITNPRQPKQRLSQTPRFSDSLDSEILRATNRTRLSV